CWGGGRARASPPAPGRVGVSRAGGAGPLGGLWGGAPQNAPPRDAMLAGLERLLGENVAELR
ncbi:MAG: hypothetical protein ABW133_19985, partial [Polyangiaceae bacterium]